MPLNNTIPFPNVGKNWDFKSAYSAQTLLAKIGENINEICDLISAY